MKYTIEIIKEIARKNPGIPVIYFWGHTPNPKKMTTACFSQWYPCAFEVDGITYNCAEQYMMAEKARVFNDEEVLSKILVTSNPKDIKALGREVKNFDAMKWSSVSKDIVVKGNLHKFAQNMDLFHFLHETGNKVLVEASPYDTIWGIGMQESDEGIINPHNWKGLNQLGFALMEVRDDLIIE